MGIVELCHGRESSIDFLAGALYTGSLISITSLLASESCLSNLQNFICPLYPEPPNGPASKEPEPEVADLDLEAAGQGPDPDLQAEPGLEPEPELTKAGLDLGPDLLSLENAPG